MALTPLKFTKSWENPTDFPTYEESESKVRADLQLLHDETRDYINDTLVPALSAMEDTCASLGGTFYATIGTTTNAEIWEAYQADKAVYAIDESQDMVLPAIVITETVVEFRGVIGTSSYYVSCSSNTWSDVTTYDLQTTDRLTTEVTADSTDEYYPSAKAVYDAIQSAIAAIPVAEEASF